MWSNDSLWLNCRLFTQWRFFCVDLTFIKQGVPDFPFPGHIDQLWRRDPEAFPDQCWDIITPPSPGSSPRSPPHWSCLEHLPREAPCQLNWLLSKQRISRSNMSSPGWLSFSPFYISKGDASHPPEKAHLGYLYPWSRLLSHHPSLMTGYMMPVRHAASATCSLSDILPFRQSTNQWRQLQVNIGGVMNILFKCVQPKSSYFSIINLINSKCWLWWCMKLAWLRLSTYFLSIYFPYSSPSGIA